jgi:DNA-binding SARP family transcriptional activator
MSLSLRLFGSLEITVYGQPMPRQERRAGERLLALLALRRDRATPRKALAGLLWPDSDEDRAQFYLRRTLSELRKALGEASVALIAPDRRSLSLDPDLLECDVRRFDSALTARDWATAVGLYRGPLLEGWDDEWLLLERTTREQNFLLALEETAVGARSSREAIAGLRKIVAIEPGRESAWRALLESLAAAGDAGERIPRAAALPAPRGPDRSVARDPRLL